MLDLSQYPKRVFTEEEAWREVENTATSFAIEDMYMTESEKQIAFEYLMGRIAVEEFRKRFLDAE